MATDFPTDSPFGVRRLTPTVMNVCDVLARTWAVYKQRLGLCIGAHVIVWGISGLAELLLTYMVMAIGQAYGTNKDTLHVGAALMWLTLLPLSMWLFGGHIAFQLKLARNEPVTFADLFTGGKWLLRLLGVILFLMLVMFAVSMVVLLPLSIAFPHAKRLVSILVFLISMVIFSLVYWQSEYLIVDQNAGLMESLRLSREITKGNRLRLIPLMFIMMAIGYSLGCLISLEPFGKAAAAIVAIPLMSYATLMLIVAYLAMTGQLAQSAGDDITGANNL